MSRRTLLLVASVAAIVLIVGAVSAVAITRSNASIAAEDFSPSEGTPTTTESLESTTSTPELPESPLDEPTLDELLSGAEDAARGIAEQEGWDYDEVQEDMKESIAAGLDEVKPWFQEQGVDSVVQMLATMMDYADSFNQLVGEDLISLDMQSTWFFADAIKIADLLEWQYSETGENCDSFDTWFQKTTEVSVDAWSQIYPAQDAATFGLTQSLATLDFFYAGTDSYSTSVKCFTDILDTFANEG